MASLQPQLATRTTNRALSIPGVIPWVRSFSLLSADLLAFGVAVILAFALDIAVVSVPLHRVYAQLVETGPFWHGWGTILVLASLLAFFGGRGQYTSRVPFWSEVGTVVSGAVIAMLCDTFVKAAVYGLPYGYEGAARWMLFIPLLLVFRQFARSVLDTLGLWSLRTLVIGTGNAVGCATRALESEPRLGYKVLGTADLDSVDERDGVRAILQSVRTQTVEFVVVALGHQNGLKERALVSDLARHGIMFALVPTFEGLPVLGFNQQYFFSHDIMMLVCRNNLARPLCRMVKQVFDQIVAAGLLVLLSPLFLVLTALVRRDGGPAFYGHTRIGAGSRTFKCLKFRSMVRDADKVLAEVLRNDPEARAEWTETQKLRNDPRITPVGQFLRKTSLDELPQLINVLTGEMSLVGPRPIVDAEVDRYGSNIDYYYGTRPGMTGLWQVSGRSDASYDRRVQLDVWYVRNWTLWHDITILLKTLPAVIRKEGAV